MNKGLVGLPRRSSRAIEAASIVAADARVGTPVARVGDGAASTGREVAAIALPEAPAFAHWCPADDRMYAFSASGVVSVIHPTTHKVEAIRRVGGTLRAAAWCPVDEQFYLARSDGSVQRFDPRRRRQGRAQAVLANDVAGIIFVASWGKLLMVPAAAAAAPARTIDPLTFATETLPSLAPANIRAIAYSPHDSAIAFAGDIGLRFIFRDGWDGDIAGSGAPVARLCYCSGDGMTYATDPGSSMILRGSWRSAVEEVTTWGQNRSFAGPLSVATAVLAIGYSPSTGMLYFAPADEEVVRLVHPTRLGGFSGGLLPVSCGAPTFFAHCPSNGLMYAMKSGGAALISVVA